MFEAYACSGFCGFLLPELRRRLLRRVRVFFSPGCGAMRSIISAVAPYEPIGAGSGAEALSSAAAGAVVDGDATGEFAGVAAGVTAGVAAGAVLACVCCTSFCSAFSFTASCLALSCLALSCLLLSCFCAGLLGCCGVCFLALFCCYFWRAFCSSRRCSSIRSLRRSCLSPGRKPSIHRLRGCSMVTLSR